jgi:hypothetical protein
MQWAPNQDLPRFAAMPRGSQAQSLAHSVTVILSLWSAQLPSTVLASRWLVRTTLAHAGGSAAYGSRLPGLGRSRIAGLTGAS